MSGKIFINYRRGDEPGFTQALLGRLEQAFPSERLFIDVDSIPPGVDFVRMLESQVAQCDAMLTVIGNNWLDATDEQGRRRLDDPHDFVRLEIESALKQDKRVIPVLVHQARMPHPDELPEAIRDLATRNAVRLTHERFRADVQGLIKALQGAVDDVAAARSGAGTDRSVKPPARRPRVLVAVAVCAVVAAAAAAVWLIYPRLNAPTHEVASAPPQPAPPPPAAVTQTPVTLPTPTPSPPPVAPPREQASAAPPPAPSPSVNAVPPPPAPTPPVSTPAPTPVPDVSVEIAYWSSIKDEKDPRLFEAYLRRYPDGIFADIAKITLEQMKAEARAKAEADARAKAEAETRAKVPAPPPVDDSAQITDAVLLNELRDRLYELNFDPGPLDGPLTDAAHKAIQDFQKQVNAPATGVATMGVLRRLRELGSVKPWGTIVFGKEAGKWGMAWNEATRKAAVARARISCGDSSTCPLEVSFFGSACGAFAYSGSSFAISAREDVAKAKAAALSDCGQRGKTCQIIASVCADGAERFTAN
jgi:hypothetical protein